MTSIRNPELGKSRNKSEAIAFVQRHSNYIASKLGHIPRVRKQVNWGTAKGQGRRRGNMITGGMSARLGTVTYDGVDLSGFSELTADPYKKLVLSDAARAARYAGAYNGGCNHLEAMAFAICPNITLSFS